jgi:hypothetical protein
MEPSRSTAARLQEREEIVASLCILVKYAPLILTSVWLVAVITTVVGLVTDSPDRAALTIALTITPCVALGWVSRHLVLGVLGLLDLKPPEDDSARDVR